MGGFIRIIDIKQRSMLVNAKRIVKILEGTLEDSGETVCAIYVTDRHSAERIVVRLGIDQVHQLIIEARNK